MTLLLAHPSWSVCVSSKFANLREKPSTKARKTWVVGKYMPLRKISRKGNWLKVKDVDGVTHWVYAGAITRSYRCMVVNAAYATLRTGPGVHYPKAAIEVADRYMPFRKLDKRDGWFHLQDSYGKKYWVHGKLVWEPIITQRVSF